MRVIVSLTTIPRRVNSTLKIAIDSILTGTLKPYSIELHVPPDLRRSEVWQARGRSLSERVTECYHPDDPGPVLKLGSLALNPLGENGSDDLIVTVDDDIWYRPEWLAAIVAAAETYPDDAIGFSGWGVGGFLAGTGSFQFATPPCFVDVLEGWAGAAYRRRFFDGIDILKSPPAFQFVDDVWISSVLNRRGIKRRLIGFPLAEPIDDDQKGIHNREDFREMNRLAVLEGFGDKADETGPVVL